MIKVKPQKSTAGLKGQVQSLGQKQTRGPRAEQACTQKGRRRPAKGWGWRPPPWWLCSSAALLMADSEPDGAVNKSQKSIFHQWPLVSSVCAHKGLSCSVAAAAILPVLIIMEALSQKNNRQYTPVTPGVCIQTIAMPVCLLPASQFTVVSWEDNNNLRTSL